MTGVIIIRPNGRYHPERNIIPAVISVTLSKGIIYPVSLRAFINAPAASGMGGIGIK
jgi:hypothetical protein